MVCYKIQSSAMDPLQPWLLLRQRPADGGVYLYSHPSFLAYSVPTAQTWTLTDGTTKTSALNLTALDMRTSLIPSGNTTALVSASSWCGVAANTIWGQGVDCITANQASITSFATGSKYFTDLLTLVNDSQVCPVPFAVPNGLGSTGQHRWWRMTRTSNSSTMVEALLEDTDTTRWQLPPVKPTTTHRYKLCIYKAGDAASYNATTWVAKAGLVYQLSVSTIGSTGASTSTGEDGFWVPTAATGTGTGGTVPAASALAVTSNLNFNSTLRFMEYDATTTRLAYESIATGTVTTSGLFSRTPVVTSGTAVTFSVQVADASGQAYPFGTYPVDVYRCAGPGTGGWNSLDCAQGASAPSRHANALQQSTGSFSVENVDANAGCNRQRAAAYGWPSSGLRQMVVNGRADFTLRYTSACNSGGEFGCGVYLRGTAPDGTVVQSKPMWLNVLQQYPSAMALGDSATNVTAITPEQPPPDTGVECVAPSCFQMTCLHNTQCVLYAQALQSSGTAEYAPLGRFRAAQSTLDSVALTNVQSFSSSYQATWSRGGVAAYTNTPRLLGTADVGYGYFNLSFDSSATTTVWIRAVIKVVRLQPATLIPASLRPIDVFSTAMRALPRQPAQRWYGTRNGNALVADTGSYMEAMVPYELRYSVPSTVVGTEVTVAEGLTGWTLGTSGVPSNNRLLGVHEANGQAMAENLDTQSIRYASNTFSASTMGDSNGWYMRFRMYSNVGCSRFSGGCTITFSLTKSTATDSPSMTLTTPVRVIGTTLEVWAHKTGTSPRANSQTTTTTAREGFTITALPGTPCGSGCFYYDEFHTGDIFGLINGPSPADGVRNRDQVIVRTDSTATNCAFQSTTGACLVQQYTPGALTIGTTGNSTTMYWGATWTMKPNRPCYKCDFTFHSTEGAGPYTYQRGTSFSSGEYYGVKSLTFADEDAVLVCSSGASSAVDVLWPANSSTSRTFSVSVTPSAVLSTDATGLQTTTPFEWPQWQVVLDTANDVSIPSGGVRTVLQNGAAGTGVFITQTGTGGALFNNLQISSATGSLPSSTASFSCSVDVTLVPDTAHTVSKSVSITAASAATSACPAAATPCEMWQTDIPTLQPDGTGAPQISFSVLFQQTVDGTTSVDTTARNITIVPATAPLQDITAATNLLSFTDNVANPTVEVPSYYNVSVVSGATPVTYTFGKLGIKFVRSAVDATAGTGTLGIAYDGNGGVLATGWPARDARFKICSSVWDAVAGAEALEISNFAPLCATIRLWVVPDPAAPPAKKSALMTEPAAGDYVPGVGAACSTTAASLLTFQTIAYYEMTSLTVNRFVVYDVAVSYSLNVGGQVMVPAASTSVTNTTLTVAAQAPTAGLDATTIITHGGLMVPIAALQGQFQLYMRNPTTAAVTATVTARNSENTQDSISSFLSTTELTFTVPSETFEAFTILDKVAHDDECPRKRLLSENRMGYRTYVESRNPGQDWDYTAGVAVGLPFPLQAVVLTDAAKRAWAYGMENTGNAYINVNLDTYSGCGTGGTMVAWQLMPSDASQSQLLHPGLFSSSSFGYLSASGSLVTSASSSATASLVPIRNGVATAWPVFSSACEACVIRVELCYMAATSSATCFSSISNSASDQLPILQERSKLSKPLSVRDEAPTDIQIFTQSTPAERAANEIMVGQEFSIGIEAVKVFSGGWAVRDATAVTTATVTIDSSYTAPTGSRMLRYGNGGWLQSNDNLAANSRFQELQAGVCNPVASAVFGAATTSTVYSTSAVSTVTFYFTRPCSSCNVKLTYSGCQGSSCLTTQLNSGRKSFLLQNYASPILSAARTPLTYAVATCATSWAWAGIGPSPSVRKQMPFGLVAWRVDRNGFPSWEGTQQAPFTPKTTSAGNGAGGEMLVTSPLGTSGRTQTREGVAVARASVTRACYKCAADFAGVTHDFSVLTDATQLIAMPNGSDTATKVWVPSWWNAAVGIQGANRVPTESAQWSFELYAADDLGDRAYTAGGPTILPMQPKWSGRKSIATKLDVQTKGVVLGAEDTIGGNVVQTGVSRVLTTSGIPAATDGIPSAETVARGSEMYNGIPFDFGGSNPAGWVTIQVDGLSSNFPLGFSGPGSLKTRQYGSSQRLTVDLTGVADRVAIDSLQDSTYVCNGLYEGQTCFFHAYAVGPRVVTGATAYYLSTANAGYGSAKATATCATTDCTLEVSPTSAFVRGVAKIGLRAVRNTTSTNSSGSCTCTVSVTAPNLVNASAQVATITYPRSRPVKFTWQGSSTLTAPSMVGGLATVDSVTTRYVELKLQATDENGKVVESADPIPAPQGVVDQYIEAGCGNTCRLSKAAMQPPGCFNEQGNPYATPDGLVVIIYGWFTAGTSCTIPTGVLGTTATGPSGWPIASSLEVTLQTPVKVEIVPSQGLGLNRPVFSGLTGVVGNEPAATVGGGAWLSVRTVDAAGKTCVGDYHTLLTVDSVAGSGSTEAGVAGGTLQVTGQSAAGVANLKISPGWGTTLTDGTHSAWQFNLVSKHRVVNTSFVFSFRQNENIVTTELNGNTAGVLGPVYYVRQATKLLVEAVLGDAAAGTRVPSYGSGVTCEDDPIGLLGAVGGCETLIRTNLSRCAMPAQSFVDFSVVAPATVSRGAELGLLQSSKLSDICPQWCSACPTGYIPRVYWLAGYPFSFKVSACDEAGNAITGAADRGSDAAVVFRPMNIPCVSPDRTAEAAWYANGCGAPYQATGANGASGATCEVTTFAALPDCEVQDWVTAPSANANAASFKSFPEEFNLANGVWTANNVRYLGTATGSIRFGFNTYDLGQDMGTLRCDKKGVAGCTSLSTDLGFDTAYAFVGELYLQTMAHLRVRGSDVTCTYPDVGTQDSCTVPAAYTSVLTTSSFTLAVDIVDPNGDLVRGESLSSVSVTATCEGNGSALLGTEDPATGTRSFNGVPTASVSNGGAVFSGLVLNSACTALYVSFSCQAPKSVTVPNNCGQLRALRAGPIVVSLPAGSTPSPPVEPLAPLQTQMKLKSFGVMALSAAKAAFDSFVSGLTKDDFASAEATMLKVLKASVAGVKSVAAKSVCLVPSSANAAVPARCEVAGGVTDATDAWFPCLCTAVSSAPAPPPTGSPTSPTSAPSAAPSTISVSRRLLQTDPQVDTAASMRFDITMTQEAANVYQGNDAIAALGDSINTAIAEDVASPNSVILTEGGPATSSVNASDLGLQTATTTPPPTPAPPTDAPDTPQPIGTTAAPDTPEPSRAPETPAPDTAAPTPAPPTASPTAGQAPVEAAGAAAPAALLMLAAAALATLA
eukprot:TRINITY_DN2006_c3_g2_i3.p1 TRINITY_DN2006_c3_g2~~TRINITY_DN2006_c3_g2_i3.p1  ORF type:complete len:3276 (+),score=1117.62 TRINITY_DN2006_c3_g2_i3:1479-11306(+)